MFFSSASFSTAFTSKYTALLVIFFGGTFLPTTVSAAEFIIKNQKAPQEISENSTVYINGKPVAHFMLDNTTKEANQTVTIPDNAENIHYELCGKITIKTPAGKTETHEINSLGILYAPQNKTFLAVVTSDFRYYYLADPNNPDGHKVLVGRSNICASPSV